MWNPAATKQSTSSLEVTGTSGSGPLPKSWDLTLPSQPLMLFSAYTLVNSECWFRKALSSSHKHAFKQQEYSCNNTHDVLLEKWTVTETC